MGDAADDLIEAEEQMQLMHDIGQCEDFCSLCHQEYIRAVNRAYRGQASPDEMDNLDEKSN